MADAPPTGGRMMTPYRGPPLTMPRQLPKQRLRHCEHTSRWRHSGTGVVVVLLPFDEGLDVDRRDNPWLVPQRTYVLPTKCALRQASMATMHRGNFSKAS